VVSRITNRIKEIFKKKGIVSSASNSSEMEEVADAVLHNYRAINGALTYPQFYEFCKRELIHMYRPLLQRDTRAAVAQS
jgi:hypothetical protein